MENLQRYSEHKPTTFDTHICDQLDHLWVAPVSISRDAGLLTQSNWAVVSEEILRNCYHEESEVHRFGHWACGWYEILLIHPEDKEALKIADNWASHLADYPVACDESYSRLQLKTAADNWERFSLSQRMETCIKFDISVFAARRDEIPTDRTGEVINYLAA
jgi:hypothetical protein